MEFRSADHSIHNINYEISFAKRNTSLKVNAVFPTRMPYKVKLRKANLLGTNLIVETLREITNNFVATSNLKPLGKSTRLQKTLSERHGAANSRIPQDLAFNRVVLGTAYIRPFITLGEVAHPSKTSNSCKREYKAGQTAPTKANTYTTASRAEIRDDHSECNRANGTGSSNPQQSVKAPIVTEMPENHGGRYFVRRKTMVAM